MHTFIFADLAGFTALTEAHGDEEAAELVARFCREVRALLPDHEAHEVKALGDALMLRSEDAARAVRLALHIAHEVGGCHGFPAVRVGLHTGPAVERERDWFGATVNIASRVSAAAIAGEVLVSDATRVAAADHVDGVEFESRGPQRFRHVSEPVEVFSVVAAGEHAPRSFATDPVCHMAVDPNRAAARRGEHLFCSEACAARFDELSSRPRG